MFHPGDSGVARPLIAGQATVLHRGIVGSVAIGLALLSIAWQPRGSERAGDVARRLGAWWPQRPPRFRLTAGNMLAMLYNLSPVGAGVAPFARWYSAEERADARSQGISLYVWADVAHCERISEGLASSDGLSLLAGAEFD
jgi:hypothetical protein